MKILRQLVELQLSHSQEIKAIIDRAWGVSHHKQKKEKGASAGENSNGIDRNDMELKPVGQDSKRERYWIADGPCSLIFGFKSLVFPFPLYRP